MPQATAKCPFCRSYNIAYKEKSEFGGGFVHTCKDCGKDFTIDYISPEGENK